jgi:hypothetical protein
MTFPRARLAVSAALFLAWLGYLLYVVLASQRTIVLSRPQLLVAGLCILGDVSDDGSGKPAREVKVIDVFWSAPADLKLAGQNITVDNLPDAAVQGYIGPGKYILPLNRVAGAAAEFRISPIPSSPAYVPAFVNVQLFSLDDPMRAPRVAHLAHEHLGVDEREALARIQNLSQQGFKGRPVMLGGNIPRDAAVAFWNASIAMGADIALPGNDVRVYPLTPETKEQLDEMIEARQ